jgi:hypothetical protein
MNQYIGNIGDKIPFEATVKSIKEFASSYGYNRSFNIYTFEDAEGNTIVWKSSSIMEVDEGADYIPYFIKRGDKLSITATVKDHKEYKGTNQTVILRPKYKVISKSLTREECLDMKAKELLATLQEGDYTWEIPFKQYKQHYSDCETVPGSFKEGTQYQPKALITIVVRKGRMKNSGVRGETFGYYTFKNEHGKEITYKAVSEENATKRVNKENPGHTWKCTVINWKEYNRPRYLV